jgi:hypothetical protein
MWCELMKNLDSIGNLQLRATMQQICDNSLTLGLSSAQRLWHRAALKVMEIVAWNSRESRMAFDGA